MSGLSRRRFLGIAGGAVAGGAIAGRLAWSGRLVDAVDGATAAPGTTGTTLTTGATGTTGPPGSTAGSTPASADRVLVIVQLAGGNDGLNTLVPAGDGRYHDARPTLAVAEDHVVRLAGTDRWGLHPSLAPLVPAWDQGRLALVDGIGFPDQTRSHFAASDTWWSAAPASGAATGWVGRWLDGTADPTNPLQAIALGGGSPALVGERSLATVVLDPASFALRAPRGSDARAIREAFLATAAPLASDPVEAAAQQAIPSALDAVDLLAEARSGAPTDTGAGESVEELLGTAAGIIDLRLGTKVILVSGNGFDTHADQAERHPALLTDLAEGLVAFTDAMAQQGRADDVLVITTSEFGRRVQENGSGTDHGEGGVQLLLGPTVAGGRVVGEADLGRLDDGDVRTSIDARSLYANALDWVSGSTGAADEVLGATYDRLALLH